MTIDEHVKRASRLSPLEIKLRDALRRLLEYFVAGKHGPDRETCPVCLALDNARTVLAEADETEQRLAERGKRE